MLTIEDIERNISEEFGIDKQTLYENAHGREKMLVTSVRYVFWYILHFEYRWKGISISSAFNRKPRIIWRGISLAKFRIVRDNMFIDIYRRMKKERILD